MGQWGVNSYENDDAAEALDAAFERVHDAVYEELTDDRNPMSLDQVQQKLANEATLAAAIRYLEELFDGPFEEWDDELRLAYAGVVVRHAEFGVPIDAPTRARAIEWLEGEAIEWSEATVRKLRRDKEIRLLRSPTAQ